MEFYDCIYSTFAVQSYMRGVWFMQNQNLSNGWLVEKWALTVKESLPCKWILVLVTKGNFLFCKARYIGQGFASLHNTPSGFVGSKHFTLKSSSTLVFGNLGKWHLWRCSRHFCRMPVVLPAISLSISILHSDGNWLLLEKLLQRFGIVRAPGPGQFITGTGLCPFAVHCEKEDQMESDTESGRWINPSASSSARSPLNSSPHQAKGPT